MRLAFDPGIGFGKTVAHNLALLRDREVVEICTAGSRQAVTVTRGTGRRDPASCTATRPSESAAPIEAPAGAMTAWGVGVGSRLRYEADAVE